MFFAPRFDENEGKKNTNGYGMGMDTWKWGWLIPGPKSWSLLFACFFFVWGEARGLYHKRNGALCSRVDVLIRKLCEDVFHSVTRLAIPKVPHQNNDSAALRHIPSTHPQVRTTQRPQ